MPISFKKDKSLFSVSNSTLQFVWNKERASFSLSRLDGKIRAGELTMRARVISEDGGYKELIPRLLHTEEPHWIKGTETPAGKLDLMSIEVKGNVEFRMRMEFYFPQEGNFILTRVYLKNESSRNARVIELVPFAYRGAGDGLEMGLGYSGWRFYRMGYQSWSPAGSISVLSRDYSPRLLGKIIGASPHSEKPDISGKFHSDWMAQIYDDELELSFLLGFITTATQLCKIEFEVRYQRFRRLEAIASCEGILLEPAEELASEWLMVSLSERPIEAQRNYYELLAEAMGARKSKPLSGWCSWYYYYSKIDETELMKNLENLGRLNPVPALFQLDDGFEPYIGEWLNFNSKFYSPPKKIVEQIHKKGAKAGVWLAPFIASISSPFGKAHRDWFLKDKYNRPKIAMLSPIWKGIAMGALDTTHPNVKNWLSETVKKLVKDYGFDFLKLDFLYSASLPGKRYNPKATGAMALREGLRVIRESAGDEAFILGCGCPLGPAVGIVDAMRVSQDIDVKWKNWIDKILGMPIAPSLESCFKNNMARALQNKILWINDPDCIIMRRGPKGLNKEQLKSELTLFYLLGGMMILSENLSKLKSEDFLLYSLALPASEKTGFAPDLLRRDFPRYFLVRDDEMTYLAIFNFENRARKIRFRLSRLGIEGSYYGFEFWKNKWLGKLDDLIELGEFLPYEVKYLGLSPVKEKEEARVVGASFHLGMGVQGLKKIRYDEGKKVLELELELLGKRSGDLYVKLRSREEPLRIEVDFKDRFKLERKIE